MATEAITRTDGPVSTSFTVNAAPPENEAPPADPQDDDDDDQGDPDNQTPPNPNDPPADPDLSQRESAVQQAEREAIAAGAVEAYKESQRGGQREATRADNRQKVRGNYGTLLKSVDEHTGRIFVSDGNGGYRAMTADEKSAYKGHFAGLDDLAYGAAEAEIEQTIIDAVRAKFPNKEAREAFDAATKPDMGVAEWLDLYAEHVVPHTKAVKKMKLDDLIAVSPELKKEVAARDLAQFKAGRNQGQNDDPEEPHIKSNRSPAGRKTFEQLQAGYGDGSNNDAEDAEYRRQSAERAKA